MHESINQWVDNIRKLYIMCEMKQHTTHKQANNCFRKKYLRSDSHFLASEILPKARSTQNTENIVFNSDNKMYVKTASVHDEGYKIQFNNCPA